METIRQHRARLLTQHVDLSKVPMSAVITGRDAFIPTLTKAKTQPEDEAMWFYVTNHAMAVLERQFDPAEPLGNMAPLVVDYHARLTQSAMRMYYYLLQICVRESRHAGSPAKLHAKWPQLTTFHSSYRGTDQTTALNALTKLKHSSVTLGELADFLSDSFYMCSYSGGYGGKAWGGIADVLKQFVHGQITGEMMLDTAFTLCHNNGPIFNKGMLYEHYDSAGIKEILDVQRAGMIPQYVNDVAGNVGAAASYAGRKFVTPALIAYVTSFSAVTTEFHGSVDWAKLKQLGALGTYSKYVDGAAKAKPKSPAEVLAEKAAAKAKAEAAANQWQILPNLTATKFKPARAAA